MEAIRQRVASLEGELTPAIVERIVRELQQQQKDGAHGVGAISLVRRLAGDLALRGEEIVWLTIASSRRCVVRWNRSLRYAFSREADELAYITSTWLRQHILLEPDADKLLVACKVRTVLDQIGEGTSVR